jgi:predicted MFS family arabinose efflux permease
VLRVPPSIRPVVLLAFANSAADAALLPLLPSIRDDFGLSGAETGAIVAATTITALFATVPVGQLAARLGAQRLLLASAALIPLSLAAMALSPSLGVLLAARVAFGLSFTVNWSIGVSVATARVRGAAGTGAVLAVSGLGWLVGPLLSGVLAAVAGWRAPLLVAAVLTLPVVLPFRRVAGADAVAEPVALRATLRRIAATPAAAWGVVISALLGLVTGTIGVLVPTTLADNGVGSSGIGIAIALSSVVWIASAFRSARIGPSRIDVRLVGLAAAALAACWAVPVLSLSSGALVGFLVLAAACRAALGSLLFPLGTGSGDEAAAASYAGVLNLAWAAPALVAPILAGVAQQQGATRFAFAVVCLLGALVAAGMLVSARRLGVAPVAAR